MAAAAEAVELGNTYYASRILMSVAAEKGMLIDDCRNAGAAPQLSAVFGNQLSTSHAVISWDHLGQQLLKETLEAQ
jgi:hypothetical protein